MKPMFQDPPKPGTGLSEFSLLFFFLPPNVYILLKFFPFVFQKKRKLLTHASHRGPAEGSTDKKLTSAAAAAIRPDLPKAADRFIGQRLDSSLGSRAGENVSGQEAVVPFLALCPLISLFLLR